MNAKPSILVIDDEIEIQNLLIRVISSMGYRVLTAGNAEDGLSLMKANSSSIGLVILDLLIPGMSGWDIFPIIQEEKPGTPILISSGFSNLHDVTSILKDGYVESLPKPYTIQDLRMTITRLVQTS